MKKARQLEGKIALITGGTRGIGAAITRGFVAEGAQVFFHGRDAAAGRAMEQETGGRFLAADFSDPAQVDILAAKFKHECSRLDILVNNAGVELVMPFVEFDASKLDRMWLVNVRAPAQLTYALLPALRKSSSASVINVTSLHDTIPYPHNSGYSMTKAALAMLTRTIAIELAAFGVRANNFAPGAVETDINREAISEMRSDFAEWIPAGHVAQVEEMIGPAVFLASDASRYVTGATLVADGGYSQNLVRYRL